MGGSVLTMVSAKHREGIGEDDDGDGVVEDVLVGAAGLWRAERLRLAQGNCGAI